MDRIVINSIEDYKNTQRRIEDLLSGKVSKDGLVVLARSLAASEDQEVNVEGLRACIFASAGVRFKDTSLIKEGIQIWECSGLFDSATSAYNLASSHLHLWQFAVKEDGLGNAWLNERAHLHEARPWKNKAWRIPEVSGEFVARMEDVLDLYEEEYDAERPVVCFDETSKQLIGHTRTPIAAEPREVGAHRLRVQAQRQSQPVYVLRAEGRMETRGGYGAAHSVGLRRADEMAGR